MAELVDAADLESVFWEFESLFLYKNEGFLNILFSTQISCAGRIEYLLNKNEWYEND